MIYATRTQWRSVYTDRPKQGVDILIYDKNSKKIFVDQVVGWDNGKPIWQDGHREGYPNVEQWMPLPEVPK